jgi:hypothetical protein
MWAVEPATTDESWRVGEMAGKVITRHREATDSRPGCGCRPYTESANSGRKAVEKIVAAET